MGKQYYIIRGFYLTGLGQEPEVNYFKIDSDHPDFDLVLAGDVCLTFYQNNSVITTLPALIRIDGLIKNDKEVQEFLKTEKEEHIPFLPIVQIYPSFDPLMFSRLMSTCKLMTEEVKKQSEIHFVQSSIFDFIEE
ncbi:hypothetical protein HMPREF9318_00115 [Streptococcus urinalis FB127-CNA-2]|uniref:Uncharacterized protein n=2 Tax=Streptococcus TaxID=1301 RepID=G5KEL9_9STRE|nr:MULTISPECIES: hypothetical protein [Streptococcus]MEE3699097.1 hypothetical protein [Streptococcus uberis]EHJ56441.1 hypothetical protein STRUR_0854 [Streptococcus urinalis 2285-97]EKS21917.1 hypothetical protein HMPREF9318_00115 [Streptococcus urinalis FB127-CNA-2]MBA2796813.1 hypothetical protein [Streptococcus porcinus]VEF31730.1 Uncharacterised protein [Streptococcus urinalis]